MSALDFGARDSFCLRFKTLWGPTGPSRPDLSLWPGPSSEHLPPDLIRTRFWPKKGDFRSKSGQNRVQTRSARRFARFTRIGWFARIGNSSDSGESTSRAFKIGASIANDSRESIRVSRFANRWCNSGVVIHYFKCSQSLHWWYSFPLQKPLSPTPPRTHPTDAKRTRNRPETDPNGPKRTRNGPKSSSLGWDCRGVCRDGGCWGL